MFDNGRSAHKKIIMPRLEYVRKQKEALRRAPRGERACQYAKLAYKTQDERRARNFVFAADYDVDKTSPLYRVKRYVATTLDHFWTWYGACDSSERMHYELLDPKSPSRMYFDIDGALHCDENREKRAIMLENVKRDFTQFFQDTFELREGNCDVMRVSENRDRPQSRNAIAELCEDMIVMDSGTDAKLSVHIVFPDVVMKNMFHCGAMMRRFEQWIVHRYGSDGRKNPYYVQSEDDPEQREFAIDRAVYTLHRVMRILGSSKARQKRYLYAVSPSGEVQRTFDRRLFERTLIQNTFQLPCDQDERAHMTREDGSRCPYRLRGGPNNTFELRVCEVRTPIDLNDINKYPATAEWIEPSSIGRRVVGLPQPALVDLGLTDYIPRVPLRTSTAPRTMAQTSRSSNATISNSDLNNMRRLLLARHAKQTSFLGNDASQPSNGARRRDLMRSIFTTAREVLCDIGYGKWWRNHFDVQFYASNERTDLDLSRGTIMLRPRGIRYCEVKGDEHTSNHVFFVLYLRGGARRRGGIRQMCHSSCPNRGRILHYPVTDKQISNFRLLRARADKLYALTYGALICLDLPSSQSQYKIAVRHAVALLVKLVGTFQWFVEKVVRDRVALERHVSDFMSSAFSSMIDMCVSPIEQHDADSDDDVDVDDDDDDMCDQLESNENSLDFRDRASVCDSDDDDDKYTYFGMVDAFCTYVCMRAIVQIDDEDKRRIVSRYFIVFRSKLMYYSWKTYGIQSTRWSGCIESLCQDLHVWAYRYSASPENEYAVIVEDAIDDVDAMLRIQSYVEQKLGDCFVDIRARQLSDDFDDTMNNTLVSSCAKHLLPHLDM